ncbi:MAG: EAL domain-containing protein [Acidobacteria bacterium]|nr:EAL domain-containing protein [Acidobacteriota bacterium]
MTSPSTFPSVSDGVSERQAASLVRVPQPEYDRLREIAARSALVAAGAIDGLWHWDLRTHEVYYSARWKAIAGHEESEIGTASSEWLDRVHPDDRPRVLRAIDAYLAGGPEVFESEHRLRHKSGGYRWVRVRGTAVRGRGGAATRFAGSMSDITDGKVVDALTGLPNRTVLGSRLEAQHTRARPDSLFALLFLDLDDFKDVNDTLGHQAGDELLKDVAHRIEHCLRATDVVDRAGQPSGAVRVPEHMLARIGGDEFVILLQDIPGPLEATRVAERIQRALAAPVRVGDRDVVATASIGIAVNRASLVKPEDAVRDADTAMYRAKALGKGRYELFDAEMRADVEERRRLDADLRFGIERREFMPYYQPIVDLVSGGLVGFEALLRWRHPERGVVLPAEFVPLLEATGLVLPIGRRFIEDVCAQLQAWQTKHAGPAPLSVTMNFATRQILEAGLVHRLIDVLGGCALQPEQVVVEVNESAVIANRDAAADVIGRLRSAGIRVVLDDFGTGYSSLSCLHELPIAGVKLDRTFIAIEHSHPGLVGAVVALASQLRLSVTAEGIETQAQCEQLRSLGCRYGQGYLFSHPLDAASAEALIRREPRWNTGQGEPTTTVASSTSLQPHPLR